MSKKDTGVGKREDDMKAFLRGLTKLSKQYKIVIWGCGCCGSPALTHRSKIGNNFAYTDDNGTLSYDHDAVA